MCKTSMGHRFHESRVCDALFSPVPASLSPQIPTEQELSLIHLCPQHRAQTSGQYMWLVNVGWMDDARIMDG